MSEAPANTGQVATPEVACSDARLIALLVGGLMTVGAVAQLFVPPGPVAAVVAATALSIALVATALVLRGRLLATLGGFRLAAVVLIALAATSALGTFVLQDKPADFYRSKYGAVAGLVLGLRLDDIFHSLWFAGLVALLVAGLVASAWLRLPITRRNVGFFAVHLGIVVILAGAGLSALFATKGRVDLRIGAAPASVVAVTRNGVPTGEKVPLGAVVMLDRFDVDRYLQKYRVVLYEPSQSQGWRLAGSYSTKVGSEQKLPGGASFRVEKLFPDFVLTERGVETADGGAPAIEVTVGGQQSLLMPGEKAQVESADGKVAVLFGWQRPEIPAGEPIHALAVDGGEPRPIKIGEEQTLADGTKVKALQFLPHFSYDIARKQARSLSNRPMNPALEVELSGGARRWLFARIPGHDHGKAGPKLSYAFTPGGVTAETILAVSGSEKNVLVRSGGKEELVPLAEGSEIAGVRFGKLYAQARIEHEPGTASVEMNNPAVLLQVTDGSKTGESLLVASKQDALRLSNGSVLVFEPRGNEVKAFRSYLTILEGESRREEVVAVNDPIRVGDWMLYQVNYDPNDPKYSGLEAVRDPGVSWVFAGFGFMFFGVIYMIYVSPRLRRREK
ncbi:MAG: cytochrome c biogenesis protein ResB [Myxococcales bacterium]|jgi:hypothetical protein